MPAPRRVLRAYFPGRKEGSCMTTIRFQGDAHSYVWIQVNKACCRGLI
jgi:hypothetical protein